MPSKYDWSDLEELYCRQGLNCWQIGELKGCSNTTTWKAIKRLGLPVRDMKSSVRRGRDCPRFKHGLNGYGYPSSRMDGRNKLHHRKVAEQLLGRPLTNLEIVHHSNEIRSDYRPINLWVFPDRSSHTRLHKTGTIHAETIFLGACWVVSFGPPWNTPWLEAKNASHPLDGGPRR